MGTMTGAKRIGFLACVSERGFPGPCAAKGGQAGTGRVIKGYFVKRLAGQLPAVWRCAHLGCTHMNSRPDREHSRAAAAPASFRGD